MISKPPTGKELSSLYLGEGGRTVFSRGRRSLKMSALNIQGWGSSLGSLALGPA